ncbi:restriction endonuclease subunit M [Sphingobium indicum IP26]|uniref:site-specific DNA-methyltransferase (adenine-specific) n=1 Tax=Sphingobium indicum F2 TaxID=1450518 RepID=A0A8E1C2W2_9SPHN|nr:MULTISPECIES: DNA adenine methylase [Sphingobium]EPR09628.1 restriction endonuclease subunit M [Sphingobium indicum IP26]EQB04847.1 restriction endonuclease subunit M [Sphingobium sp. HDIP04]KER36652.1 DNA methyltransferase [Sphingobium indicum F2]
MHSSTDSVDSVRPVAPAAGYMGGKRNLARRICAIIDRDEHDGYAEPFVGMGGIFLRRSTRPKAEIINDISGDVATFFRVLQEHYPYFIDMMRWRVASRSEFNRLLAKDPALLTDLQRAARFLYVQRLAFGGKVTGRAFGVDKTQGARFNITKLEPMLADIHDRLAGVVIEQLPYGNFIARYDRPGMLFFLDPPYWDCETDYGAGVFDRADFQRLAEQLAGIRGKFLLSINDTAGARAVFSSFPMREVDVTYTLSAKDNAKKAGELLISNFAFD